MLSLLCLHFPFPALGLKLIEVLSSLFTKWRRSLQVFPIDPLVIPSAISPITYPWHFPTTISCQLIIKNTYLFLFDNKYRSLFLFNQEEHQLKISFWAPHHNILSTPCGFLLCAFLQYAATARSWAELPATCPICCSDCWHAPQDWPQLKILPWSPAAQKDLITFQPPSQAFHLQKLLLMKNIVDTIPSLSYQKATAPNFPSIPSYHDSLCPGGNLHSVSNHLPVSVFVFIRILQLKNSNPQSLICCLVTIISLLLYEHLKIYSY